MTEVPEAAPVDTEPRHQPPPPSLDKGGAAAVPRPEQPTELDGTQSSATAPPLSHNLSTMPFKAGFYMPKETTEKERTDTPEGTVQLQFGQSGVRPTPPTTSVSTQYPMLMSPPIQQCEDAGRGRTSHGVRNPGRRKQWQGSQPYPKDLKSVFSEDH